MINNVCAADLVVSDSDIILIETPRVDHCEHLSYRYARFCLPSVGTVDLQRRLQ